MLQLNDDVVTVCKDHKQATLGQSKKLSLNKKPKNVDENYTTVTVFEFHHNATFRTSCESTLCSEKRDVPEMAGLKYCQQDCYMCTYILLVTPVNWKRTNKRTSGNGLWAKRVDTYTQCRKNKSGGCNKDSRMEVLPLAVIFPSL